MELVSLVQCLRIAADQPEPELIERAAALLRAGELVAFPTETVYGLGAHALQADAVAKIFRAKGRPANNPLIAHVADMAMAHQLVTTWSPVAERLATAFWPGPLTLVLPRHPDVPLAVTAGLDGVGVRMPAHPVARALIAAAGCPIAAPSANPYMGVSPTQAAHVLRGMQSSPEPILVLDGGNTDVGLESTVLDLRSEQPTVLRPGGLSVERLRSVLGDVRLLGEDAGRHALPSPGLAQRHYAPRARVRLFESCGALQTAYEHARLLDERVALLLCTCELSADTGAVFLGLDPVEYGRELYARLHALDEQGVEQIFVELPPDTTPWLAVRDRLRRASTSA